MFRTIAMLITLLSIVSCVKNEKHSNGPETEYIYIYRPDVRGRAADSVLVYKNLPYERSLELYKDADSITKFAGPEYIPSVYLSVFQVEQQKFAVISDTAATTFYKFDALGSYRRLCSLEVVLGIKATLQKKDLNNDGCKDVLFTMDSGGSYGDDTVFLFYNPKTKSLDYSPNQLLRNGSIKGDKVVSGSSFWEDTYLIKGNRLILIKERLEIHEQGYEAKETVTTYAESGKVISIDTVKLE